MTDSLVHNPQLAAAEQLLTSLPGIVSARVVAGPGGHPDEIHILATAELHPKQIVRNIESALSAGLGIVINRRIVSVAQLRAGAIEGVPAAGGLAPTADEPDLVEVDDVATAPHASRAPEPALRPAMGRDNGQEQLAGSRIIFLGHEVTVDAARTATCTVTFRAGAEEFTGVGQGFDSPQGRAEAAARAVVDALRRSGRAERLGLEGVSIVDTPGRECVLVAIRPLDGRRRSSLTGAAPLHDSPEEAAILAALQATNHWRPR
jgi:hypothetical protein